MSDVAGPGIGRRAMTRAGTVPAVGVDPSGSLASADV